MNGREAFEGKRYRAAFQEFQAGYEIEPRPGFLLDMGHAARKMGDLQKARGLYQQFLQVAPSGGERRLAEQFVGEIDRKLRQAVPAKEGTEATEAKEDSDSSTDNDAPSELAVPALSTVPVTPEPLLAEPEGLRAVPQPNEPSGEDQPGRSSKWWLWAGLGVLAAGVAAMLLLRVNRSGDDAHTSGSWGQARL